MAESGYSRHRTRGIKSELIPIDMLGSSLVYLDLKVREDRCYFHEYEEIWDNPGSVNDYHGCKHIVARFDHNRITSSQLHPAVGRREYWNCSPFWVTRSPFLIQYNNVVKWLNSATYDVGSIRWSDFMGRAFESVTEQVPDVIDVPNLLHDLFTLKGLLKQCGTLARKVQRWLHRLGAYRGHFAHLLNLRALVKNASDAFLLNEFGIQPLIRELESLFTDLTAIMKRLDFLRKTQGSVFVARYTEGVSYSMPRKLLDRADAYMFATSYLYLDRVQGNIKYTCTAHVKNNLVGLSDMLAGVKMYLGALGGKNVVTFMWDLVPFSFVVDWFFNVGGFLSRYASIQPFSGSLDVESAGCSFKKEATGILTIEGPDLTNGQILYGNLYYKEYIRMPGLDRSLNMFRPISALTPKQLEVLSALLGQRVRG